MTKLTAKKVKDYMSYRTSEGIRHCPEAIAKACNQIANEYADTEFAKAADPIDYMRLLFFNDPIEQLKARYYEHTN